MDLVRGHGQGYCPVTLLICRYGHQMVAFCAGEPPVGSL
jgi:hypothetical protein